MTTAIQSAWHRSPGQLLPQLQRMAGQSACQSMTERESLRSRCHTCVEDLNRSESWGLDSAQITALTNQILEYVPLKSNETDLALTLAVQYFYHDGPQLRALRNAADPQHEEAWEWAAREITRIMQIKGLDWSRDRAVSPDDLVQIVQSELIHALADYRFESSLRTWIYSVTIRRLRRFHRDTSALKRKATLEPLDTAAEQPVEWEEIEPRVLASVLIDDINRVLALSGDTRYSYIFRSRVIAEQSTEEIGAKLQLHPSRVRALFKIARELLQKDSGMQGWTAPSLPDDATEDTRNSS